MVHNTMISISLLLKLCVVVLYMPYCQCAIKEIEYTSKIVGNQKVDLFGAAVGVTRDTSVIDAPGDNKRHGSITVVREGVRTKMR